LVIAVCSDHGRDEAEGDGLQHQILGGVSRFQANITVAPVSVLHAGSLEDRCNADARRRRCNPILA
jgi:hypothetical protein